jgi:hypothetical protein
MVCCQEDSDFYFMTNQFTKAIDSLTRKLRNLFQRRKESSTESTAKSTAELTAETTPVPTSVLATPNHIPFHGEDPAQFQHPPAPSKWSKFLASSKSKDEIPLSTISTVGSKTPTPKPAKPSDLWKHDQNRMLQGRYDFDSGFSTKYKLKQLLGEGSFGFVWVAEHLEDQVEVLFWE